MLYNDLDKIPLDVFIDVFVGEKDKLVIDGNHTDEEIENQAAKLISEYVEIVGGASIMTEISKKNKLINLGIKVECMKIVETMTQNGEWENAVGILKTFGYQFFPSEHEKIRKRIFAILSQSQYMIECANNKDSAKPSSRMDRNYFAQERVMVMSHFGMQIRKNEITAKEYAFMVKRMCDDVKSIKRK